MDEEALKDAHKLFLETGYKGDLAKFKNLISTNPNALKDAHQLFVNTGYNKSIDDFSTLVGVKKKVPSTSISTTPNQKLVSEKKVGSSGIVKQDNSKRLDELFAKTSQNTKSNKSEEIAYQKILKNKPLVNKPIKEVNREEIAVPTKVDKQILAETPKQKITPLPQGFQELADNKIFQKAKDFETKEIAKGIDRYTSDEYDNLEKEQKLRHLSNLTNVDETKKQIFKDEVEEEANVEGILNNIKQGAKELWNNVVLNSPMALSTANQLNINPLVSTKPLSEQREQFIRLQEAKGRKRKDLTEKEILEGAKEIRFNEKVDNERLTLRNEVLGARENPAFGYFSPLKFSEKQRDELAKYKIDETNTLTEKSLADLSIMQMIKGDLLNMKDKSNSVLNKITNKEQLSEEEINFVKTFKQNTEDLQKKYDIYSDKYSNSKEKIGSVLEEAVALSSDRGLEADLKQLMLTGGKMLVGGLTILNELNPMSHLEGNDVLEKTFTESQNILTEGQKTDLPTLPDEVTSLGSAFDYTKSTILDFVPQMAIGWMTGGAGNVSKLSMLKPMVTTGLLGAGQQINEINQSNKEGLTDLSEQQKYIASAFRFFSDSAGFETYNSMFKGIRLIKSTLSTPTLIPLLRQTLNQKILNEGKDFIKTGSIQQIEEQFANILTNINRKYNLKEKNVNLLDGSGDTFKSTTTLTLFMKVAPFAFAQATKPFFNKDNTKQIDANSREILRLTEELKNTNLSEEAKSVIQKSIDNRGKENDNILKSVIDKVVGLGEEERNKVFELEKTTSDIRAKAESINSDNTISKETKQTALNDLKSEYEKSEELRKNIIEGNSTVLDVVPAEKKDEMKSNALNVLLSEKEGSNEAQFTNDVIEQKAIELYNNQIKSKDAKTEIPITETESQAEVQKPTDAQQEEVKPAENVSPVENVVSPEVANPIQEENKNVIDNYNNKLAFTRELFDGNENSFNEFVEKSNELEDVNQVDKFIEDNLPKFFNQNEDLIAPLKETIINGINNKQIKPNEAQEERNIDANGNVPVGDNADLQQREQQPEVIEVQSTADVGESKPNVKRVKSLKDAEYDVSFNEKGEVTKINSVKDGREIPKFTERVNPKTGKTTLVKNANYARIEADSKGEQLDSRIKSDDKKVFEEAVLNFEPNTEYDVALNALANGAKVSMESLQKELGNTDQKWATNQSKSEQLPSIEKLSEQIWEESGGQLDQMEIRNQLIDIIQTNPNVDSLKSKLIEAHNSRQSQKQEDELRAYLGSLSEKDLANYESIKAEDDYISELSDEEATQYYEQEYLKSIGQTKKEDNGKETTNEVGETETPSVQKRDGETTERKEDPKEVKHDKDSKSTLLKRLANTENPKIVTDTIDKLGFNYKKLNSEETIKFAQAFVKEVGVFDAYNAIKEGKIENQAVITIVYAEIIDKIPNEVKKLVDKANTIEEQNQIIKEYDDFILKVYEEASIRQTEAGQLNAILATYYRKQLDLVYTLKNQEKEFKSINGGEIPSDVVSKFTELESKYKDLLEKEKTREKEFEELQEQNAVNSIVEHILRNQKSNNKSEVISQSKAKKLADKLRSAKINRPNTFRSSFGADIVWDSAIEAVALTLEKTSDIVKSIDKGLEVIRKSDWYKNLNTKDKAKAEVEFFDFTNENFGTQKESNKKPYIDDNGNVIIPNGYIRSKVEDGAREVNELIKSIGDDLKNEGFEVNERNILDAISGYGKEVGKTKTDIQLEIAKIKAHSKLLSKLNDLQKGINREKTSVRRRELEAREILAKQQIAKLEEELGITEQNRTENAKNYAKRRIEELTNRIKNNDFETKKTKQIHEDSELREIRREKLRVQEEFEKTKYEYELKNRNIRQRVKAVFDNIYNLLRTMALTAEMSFTGIQFLPLGNAEFFSSKTLKNLVNDFKGTTIEDWKNPIRVLRKFKNSSMATKALSNMTRATFNKNNFENQKFNLEDDPNYDKYVKSGLRLLKEDVKSKVDEDLLKGIGVLSVIFKFPANVITKIDKNRKRTTAQGLIEKLRTGKVSDKNKKTISEMTLNPFSGLERANTSLLNTARKEVADSLFYLLEKEGKNINDNLDEFKKVASAINTLSFSANFGQQMTMALPTLNKILISARFWKAGLEMTPVLNLIKLVQLGNYEGNIKEWKPSVAQKYFLKTQMKLYTSLAVGTALLLYYINAGKDDDEEKAYVETDPRSSDFLKIVDGKIRTEIVGTQKTNLVLMARLFYSQNKKNGDILDNGGFGKLSDLDYVVNYSLNKAHPALAIPLRYLKGTKKENEETGKETRMLFDEDVSITNQILNSWKPIYWRTIQEINKEDPAMGLEFYSALGFFGFNSSILKEGINTKTFEWNPLNENEFGDTKEKSESKKSEGKTKYTKF